MNTSYDISLHNLAQHLTDERGNPPTFTDVDKTEVALLAYAELHAVSPPLSMRDRILANMQKLKVLEDNQQSFTLNNLPILTPEANWLDWEAAVKAQA